MKKYPKNICSDCGRKALKKFNAGRPHPFGLPIAATFHMGRCEVCKEEKPVTEPRDYSYPPLKAFEFKE